MYFRFFTRDHNLGMHFGAGIVMGLSLLILLTPFILYPFGIAGDYPNHYVAFSIAFEQMQNAPPHSFYEVQWHLFPHLAMAVLAIPAALGMDLQQAFHIFLVTSAAMPVIGSWAIHRQIHGTTSWSLLLTLPLIYNLGLYTGFLDFNFSLGLAFCLYALLLRQPDKTTASGSAILACGAAILFLSHLLGFLIFGLLIASQRVQVFTRTSALPAKIKAFFFPLYWLWPTGLLGFIWLANGPEPLPQEEFGLGMPQLTMLLRAFWGPFYFGHILSAVVLVPLFIWLIPCALFARVLIAKREDLITLGILLLATIALSQRVGGVALDFRLGLATFLFASSIVKLGALDNAPKRTIAKISTMFLACGLTLQCTYSWPTLQATHHETQAIRNSLQKLPPHSRLIAGNSLESRKFLHTGAFIALDRDGFFPQMFQVVQPIRARKPFATINMPGAEMSGARLVDGTKELPVYEKNDSWYNLQAHHGWPLQFDYLIWFSTSEGPMANYPFLDKIDEGNHFRLYRIDQEKAQLIGIKNQSKTDLP